ncbi:MAG: diadenylate cyclase CdaA [Sandaracinaceae bacterium]
MHDFVHRDALRVATDIVDILLVAYFLYRVLQLLRGTRAMQMGIGLVLVFLVYNFARRLGLITLWSILDSLLTYVVLIIVVIFQNDIRRALMRVGSRKWLTRGSARESQVIEEVVKASAALAQKRIGGLIVFERDAALDEFIEEGTKLDAAVSKELLYSIFVPSYENPMHDGAVVIRDGRVWEAGVFLPLTETTKLERTLGTRHRAAIGISEETDAVVVVVSEERGSVSLCYGGNIVRDLDTNTLRKTLIGLFESPAAKKPPATPKDRARRAKETTGKTSNSSPGDVPAASSSSSGSNVAAEEAAP